jgi:hypothetical protein
MKIFARTCFCYIGFSTENRAIPARHGDHLGGSKYKV